MGKTSQASHALLTEFDSQVARMGLNKAEYVGSAELNRWCARNRNRVYIPEWLLAEWGMDVETNSGAA